MKSESPAVQETRKGGRSESGRPVRKAREKPMKFEESS